jgi:Fe-S cluster assembly protein SufD
VIAEKSNTAQQIIDKISASAPKVGFIDDATLSNALLCLENKGIPNNKNEDYKYCNIEAVFKKEFKELKQSLSGISDISAFRLEDTLTLVVVNGVLSESLSDKVILNGFSIKSFGSMNNADQTRIGTLADVNLDAFIALNTAFVSGGFHLKIEKGTSLSIPIHILYVSTAEGDSLVNPRNLIELGENSSATIIEQFVNTGSAKTFNNFLSERSVAEGANLSSYTIQEEGEKGYMVCTNEVNVGKDGKYDNTTITLSGNLVRNNHNVVLSGTNSEAHLYGLFSSHGHQLVDNHTLVDHQVPHCESNELYKGIVNDKSTGVFNGKIFVRKDAQKTNAYQSSKNILLSDDATINTKPQLEIYADDVKCSHGTSTGKIDEEAMFYLNARGIGKESARKMLLSSFAGEVISRIDIDSLRERVTQQFEGQI